MLPAPPPPVPLRCEDDRALAWRAASLGERLALEEGKQPGTPSANAVSSSAERRLELWCKACAAGDRASFQRRLAWDRWSLHAVSPALDDELPSVDFELPSWIDTLRQVRRELATFASELPSRGERLPEESLFPEGKPAPFLEIWVPFLRVARHKLRDQAGTSQRRLRAEALGTLERQLLLDLSSLGVQVLFDRFEEYRRQGRGPRVSNRDRSNRYSAFVAAMLDNGFEEIIREYSVFARQVCAAVETWIATTAELLHRLEHDVKAIAEIFNDGNPLGRVRGLRPGLSDRHHGGRQVAELIFESGLRLIYKPRSVQMEEAVHGFLAWLRDRGLACAPPSLQFLSREDYGWVEVVRWSAITDASDFMRRAGSLFCLADALRIDDLHWENLIATDAGPVMVDCEMALQPVPIPATTFKARPRSILSSQLLTSLQLDAAGRPYEASALRGVGGQLQELSRRAWKNVNTDVMGYEVRRPVARPGTNIVRQGSTSLGPEDEPRAFLEGYQKTYRFLLQSREELLRDGGSLAAFEGCSTRILFRPTQVYAVLLSRLAAPSYLRSGAVASLLADSLNRVFVGQEERPLLWPLTHQERQALEQRDVPTFSAPVQESPSGRPLEKGFACSGLQAVRERLASLSEEDLHDQSRLLKLLLAQPPRYQVPPAALDVSEDKVLAGLPSTAEESELLRHLASLGQLLLRQEPAGFYHLYDGGCGTAITLAALALHLDDEAYRRKSLDLLEGLGKDLNEHHLVDAPLGSCHGLGGMIYSLVLLHRLLNEPRCLSWASAVAALITEKRITTDQRLDLEGGAAGAILGLLALYDATEDEALLQRAEACAEHLLGHPAARSLRSADTPSGLPAGLAHGAAGFALALARLAVRSDDQLKQQRYARWAHRLFAHEDKLNSFHGWSDGRWCNGAAGMALARLDAVSELGSGGDLEESLELAVQATISRFATTRDDLCCGRLGRADAILEIGHQLDDPWLLRTAGLAIGAVLEDAQKTGSFRISRPEDSELASHTPFFSSLSGIAYSLLRRLDPATFPCVLLFRA